MLDYEKRFDRWFTLIMCLVGFMLLIGSTIYNINKDNVVEFSISESLTNRVCVCSTKCAVEFCFDENRMSDYKDDSFVVNNNLTTGNCLKCK